MYLHGLFMIFCLYRSLAVMSSEILYNICRALWIYQLPSDRREIHVSSFELGKENRYVFILFSLLVII